MGVVAGKTLGEATAAVGLPETWPHATERTKSEARTIAFMPATTLVRGISYQPEARSLKTTRPNSTHEGITRARYRAQ